MEPPNSALPKPGELSVAHTAFLDENLRRREDLLSTAPGLAAELSGSCSDLDATLVGLRRHLTKLAVSWIYRSIGAKFSIQKLTYKLENLSLCSSQSAADSMKTRKLFGTELPQLAREVQRIGNIRQYAETVLQLERLVGDVEDAVLCVINRQSSGLISAKFMPLSAPMEAGAKQDKFLEAIKVMNAIEDILIGVIKSQRQWNRLLQCVDTRVDKTLAVLRPKVIADHRALLAQLGWPPKLVATNVEGSEVSGVPNPLVLMEGEKRKRYSHSFLALCALQHLQTRREDRKQNHTEQKDGIVNRLWAIDELVYPIAARVEYHLAKWSNQPEFMFALVFRIARDFIIGVEDILQPLIDEARLVSFSAREGWVFSMVHMLSEFLKKNMFPSLAEKYSDKDTKSEVSSACLHLIDLMVSFDKRMQSLLNLETRLYADHEALPGLVRGISVLSIFTDNPGWFKIWARVEFKDAWRKLKAELKNEKAWTIHGKPDTGNQTDSRSGNYLLATREDHKAPLITESVLKISWFVIDRCQTLPDSLTRVKFIRSTSGKFLWHFLNVLISHCRINALKSEGRDYDDDSIIRVCISINTAKYLESKLQEWSDDVKFLDMSITERDSLDRKTIGADNSTFFAEEIKGLAELEVNWLMEIIALLLRQFETRSWEYVNGRERFEMGQEFSQELDPTVSPHLFEVLNGLRNQLDIIRTSLNAMDFLDLWRSTADGLDHFIFCSILANDIRFSKTGTGRFESDMRALYSVFQPFCARPEAFFPCIRDSLKLLNAKSEEVKILETVLSTENEQETSYRRVFGISHLSPEQILKLVRKRML